MIAANVTISSANSCSAMAMVTAGGTLIKVKEGAVFPFLCNYRFQNKNIALFDTLLLICETLNIARQFGTDCQSMRKSSYI